MLPGEASTGNVLGQARTLAGRSLANGNLKPLKVRLMHISRDFWHIYVMLDKMRGGIGPRLYTSAFSSARGNCVHLQTSWVRNVKASQGQSSRKVRLLTGVDRGSKSKTAPGIIFFLLLFRLLCIYR